MLKRRNNPNDDPNWMAMPKRAPGRQSFEAQETYEAALDKWCSGIIEMSEERAKQPDNFDVSSRGWCYLIEHHGLLKGDFDKAQNLINDCRKSGRLPVDICCEDGRRKADNIEYIDDTTPDEEAERIVDYILEAEEDYHPFSFWDDQEFYVQTMTEKVDVKNLFTSVAKPFRLPIFNGGGWSDINSRVAAMRRFKYWEGKDKKCVLLYCGDLDPGDALIAGNIRKNLRDLADTVGWTPDNLIIDRFGIDADFIKKHRLTWIDNLHTATGEFPLDDPRHPDHHKEYVQTYLRKYGARKVESTALVVPRVVPHARALYLKTILKYVRADAPAQYQSSLELPRGKVRDAVWRLLQARLQHKHGK
jgi:hypothetical protein